jgi:hypothetical protein
LGIDHFDHINQIKTVTLITLRKLLPLNNFLYDEVQRHYIRGKS